MVYPPTYSYWELKEYFTDVDLAVVGSGIVGLTTAIFYKERFPDRKVLVLERGALPSGASTKNAGFACFGSLSELAADLENTSKSNLIDLIAMRYEGLQQLQALLGSDNIGFTPCGGYEVFGEHDEQLYQRCMQLMPEMNLLLAQKIGIRECYRDSSKDISTFGFAGVKHLTLNQYEGGIDTGKMMRSLLQKAYAQGIAVLPGATVTNWSESNATANLELNSEIVLKPRKVHFATNGFASQLLPELDVSPARAQVLITKPIENLKVKGTFHMDKGFYYFRNVGNRLLLGGGRNLDVDGETTTEIATSKMIQQKLDSLLKEHILPTENIEIEHRWAGIMGVGQQKKTIVKRLSDRISCSVRLGGMGVAIGTTIGHNSAHLID
jgi:glycine/D-amino acid oxidase-like deaminating enzyme